MSGPLTSTRLSTTSLRSRVTLAAEPDLMTRQESEVSGTKEQVIAAIDDSWRELRRSLSRVRSADMAVPGVCGDWTIKDIVGHITTWESELVDAITTGSNLPSSNISQFNHEAAAEKARLTVREVMARMEETHRVLRDLLRRQPSSKFEPGDGVRYQIDEASILHYEEHTAQIRSWVRKRRKEKAEAAAER